MILLLAIGTRERYFLASEYPSSSEAMWAYSGGLGLYHSYKDIDFPCAIRPLVQLKSELVAAKDGEVWNIAK